MKKYLFILGLVGTALFTACSTSDDLTAEDPRVTLPDDEPKEAALIIEAGQNSEVPIALGIGQSRGYTRAVLNPDDGDGNFKTESNRFIGVFCLATGTQTGVSNIPDAVASNHWKDDATGQLGGLLVKLKDVPAKVTNSGSTYSFKFWRTSTDKEEHYYYPMSNWMKYNFYAYYPQTNSSTTVFDESTAWVTGYEIDGSQDLIWGIANPNAAIHTDAPDGSKPFCAKYYRWRRNGNIAAGKTEKDYYPEFIFDHQLVQFNFFVKAADDAAYTNLTAVKAKITDMWIANAIYKLKFCVASQDPDFDDCQLTKDGNLADVTKKLGIKKKGEIDEDVFNGVYNQWVKPADNVVSPQAVANGYVGYIMLPPPNVNVSGDASFKYRLVMKMIYDGSPGSDEVSIELTPPKIPGTDPAQYGFVAGQSYNIIVRVVSPEEIFATAVLQEWETYEDESHNPFINYEVE